MFQWRMLTLKHRFRIRLKQKQAEEVGKFYLNMAQACFIASFAGLNTGPTLTGLQAVNGIIGTCMGVIFFMCGVKVLKEVKT